MPYEPRIAQDKPPLTKLQFNNTRGNGVYVACDGAVAGPTQKAHATAHNTTLIDLNPGFTSLNLTFYESDGANAPSIGAIRVPAVAGEHLPPESAANGAVAVLGNHQGAVQDCAVLLFKDSAVVGANCGSVESS